MWAKVRAHYVVRQDGSVLLLHRPTVRMRYGSGPCNARGVTIEHEGNLPSDSDSYWKPERFGRDLLGILTAYDPFESDDCYDDPDDSVRRLVDGFPTHVLGSVCAPDLGSYLGEAVGVIETTCEAFVPPG